MSNFRFGEDITVCDTERLEAFLMDRTDRIARADRGSDERMVARSVRAALRQHVVTIQHCFSFPAEGAGPQELIRWKVMLSWNSLCVLASPWLG
ncbi:hypothetical protein MA546_17680, partial [Streptomyces sp. T7(2022)]|uniref:hypothetical protein n=1 Tax=Streptomyces sp. T7(2022) TaxID=2916034 RepID=UPI001EE42D3A